MKPIQVDVLSSVEVLDPEALRLPAPKTVAHSGPPTSRFAVEWRPIPGTMYEASNLGMVRNAESKPKRVLTPISDRDGYLVVNIYNAGSCSLQYISRLVLLAFEGPPPTKQYQAAHNDGSRQNNNLWNLRWATPKENGEDRVFHKTVSDMRAARAATRASRRSRIRAPGRYISVPTSRSVGASRDLPIALSWNLQPTFCGA